MLQYLVEAANQPPKESIMDNVVETPAVESTAVVAKKSKEPVVHKCAKCGATFPGSGKRGRPHKFCPACRAA